MKIVISSGHGKHVSGASGVINEVTEARRVAPKVAEYLRAAGEQVVVFHENNAANKKDNLNAIVAYHNAQSRDLDISVHFNAFQSTDKPMGVEVLYYSEKDLAAKIAKAIADVSGLKNRGAKNRTDLWFLNGTKKPAILIEVCFVDSKEDVKLYQANFDAICKAIAGAVSGKSIPIGGVMPDTNGLTKVMGEAAATAAQMRAYIKTINPAAPDLADIYIAEGKLEGVRGDVAFAQACIETGNFKYEGSAVTPDQHNYCGMGVASTGMRGNSFVTAAAGVRAQIQHLKAYASTEKLATACVDPRFQYVERGIAPYVEWLGAKENPGGKGWAMGAGYGGKILKVLEGVLKMKEEAVQETAYEHWTEQHFQYLNDAGIIVHERRFGQPITRGEVFALLAQLHRNINGDMAK